MPPKVRRVKERRSLSYEIIPLPLAKGKGIKGIGFKESGEGGIRTHGSLLGYTRSPGVPDSPLQHLSIICLWRRGWDSNPRSAKRGDRFSRAAP